MFPDSFFGRLQGWLRSRRRGDEEEEEEEEEERRQKKNEEEEESFWMAGFWMHQVQMIGETPFLLQTIYWKTDLDPDARWDEKAFKGALEGLQRGYRRPSKGL